MPSFTLKKLNKLKEIVFKKEHPNDHNIVAAKLKVMSDHKKITLLALLTYDVTNEMIIKNNRGDDDKDNNDDCLNSSI